MPLGAISYHWVPFWLAGYHLVKFGTIGYHWLPLSTIGYHSGWQGKVLERYGEFQVCQEADGDERTN